MSILVHVVVQARGARSTKQLRRYLSQGAIAPGTFVRVRVGRREQLGIVWDTPFEHGEPSTTRPGLILSRVDGLLPVTAAWRQLMDFTAYYYQRSVGDLAVASLPVQLREMTDEQLARRLSARAVEGTLPTSVRPAAPLELSDEQQAALGRVTQGAGPFLLFGSPGSGKTEIYLQAAAAALRASPSAQVLVLVPEINLTPQIVERFRARFAAEYGELAIVQMHSGMTNPQRLKSWLAAHTGRARIVLGTRLAVLASLPGLALIVVDEEHDPSFKQLEGARYSARDLAVWRGRQLGAKVLLGSATPSLESWRASEASVGRYQRIEMPTRIGAGALPRVRLIDMRQQPKGRIISAPLAQALLGRIRRGEQSLIFLNRRGYAPLLMCSDCSWKSSCPSCSGNQVFHKEDRSLRCHHCGVTQPVPHACPSCGNPDILPIGTGTEQLIEDLMRILATVHRPDGGSVRLARIDADSTRTSRSLEQHLAAIHEGEVDILVGTQMVAKGHDFRRITLVAAVQPDGALFSNDYRAPERLFSLLLQAAGRAGRGGVFQESPQSQPEMWVQTRDPDNPIFVALQSYDYAAFAAKQLDDRQVAGLPPFSYQAIVRADSATQSVAQAFLSAGAQLSVEANLPYRDCVHTYPPIPLAVPRVADVERAQMLVESNNRSALLRFLASWRPQLEWLRSQPEHKDVVKWLIDVDPSTI